MSAHVQSDRAIDDPVMLAAGARIFRRALARLAVEEAARLAEADRLPAADPVADAVSAE